MRSAGTTVTSAKCAAATSSRLTLDVECSCLVAVDCSRRRTDSNTYLDTQPAPTAADAAREHETPLDLAFSPLCILYVSNFDRACCRRSKW